MWSPAIFKVPNFNTIYMKSDMQTKETALTLDISDNIGKVGVCLWGGQGQKNKKEEKSRWTLSNSGVWALNNR